MHTPADLVIKERRSPTATAALIAGAIAAGLLILGLVGWFSWNTGYDARGTEVENLSREAREASEEADRVASEKEEALAKAEEQKSNALREAEAEKSLAIREVEARARELLSTTQRDRKALRVENEVLREKVLLLEGELIAEREETSRIKQSLDSLQRQLQIDKSAYEELTRELTNSSDNLGQLHDELNFYRSILSPEGEKTGVQIQGLRLKETGTPNQYQYRITLIQARKHDSNVRGRVNLEIEGSQDGIGKIVDVGIFGEAPDPANFKYYQHFSGVFQLPDDFVATGAKVVVYPNGSSTAEQWYPWPTN